MGHASEYYMRDISHDAFNRFSPFLSMSASITGGRSLAHRQRRCLVVYRARARSRLKRHCVTNTVTDHILPTDAHIHTHSARPPVCPPRVVTASSAVCSPSSHYVHRFFFVVVGWYLFSAIAGPYTKYISAPTIA